MTQQKMVEVAEVVQQLGKNFDEVRLLNESSYKDCSTIILCPTRGTIHWKVVNSWQGMMTPMNQKRIFIFCAGAEVGQAYNQMILNILNDPVLSKFKYVMTVEDDNIQPPDAHLRLLESIEHGHGYDAVSGLYFTKGPVGMPMAYGDPQEFMTTGNLDFKPRNVVQAIDRGLLVEVNGIAMGCSLYRMDLFRYVPPPWFVTLNDIIPGVGAMSYTQDLNFCEKAKRMGKKFAVDCRVKVGHLDVETGLVY
jgi:hypothetical protein